MKKPLLLLSMILVTVSLTTGIEHSEIPSTQNLIENNSNPEIGFTGSLNYSDNSDLIELNFSENLETPNYTETENLSLENNITYPDINYFNETEEEENNNTTGKTNSTNSTDNSTQENTEEQSQESEDSDSRYIVIDPEETENTTTNQTDENQTETPQSAQNQSKNQTKAPETEENQGYRLFQGPWSETQEDSKDKDNEITGSFSNSKTYLKQIVRYVTTLINNLSVQ